MSSLRWCLCLALRTPLARQFNPPTLSLGGAAAFNVFIATGGALSALMRRFFSHAAGSHSSPPIFSYTPRRPSSRRPLPCAVSGRPTSPADSSIQGRPSLNPPQKSHLDCVNSISRPPLDLARISEPSSSDRSWGHPGKGIDVAHITEVLASKNCFFLLNHDRSIKSSIGIPHLVVRVLQNQENPLFSLKFCIWVSSINQGITSDRSIRSALSHILFKKGPVILSIDLLRDVNLAGCQITEDLFCILIGSWGKLGLAKYCNDVFSQMSFLGLKPSTRLYNALIDALVKSNSLDQAYLKFHHMPGDNCFPDRFTYNILIHGVSKVGIVDEALRLMKQMEASGYSPNVFTYTILVDGFCNSNMVEEAFQVLDTMRKRKIPPTGATYRTLVHGTFRCMESHEAYKLLVSFVDSDPVLHMDVCCTALYCLSKSGMAAEANEFLSKLRKRGYFPDNSTFNTVMAGLVRDLNIGETCKVMDDFVAGGGKPGFNIYIGLIAKLCKEGWENDTDRYLKQMMSDGLVQNVVSFNMLIDCFVKAEMMNRASNIFEEMVKSGVNPNLVTFNTLISGYCKIKEISRAREHLKMLLECGLVPDVITFSSVIDGLCRAHQIEDAFNCFTEMIEWGVSPNNVTYNTLVRALSASGEISKATKLFKKMNSDGISPDIFTFNSLILSHCKMNKMNTARSLLEYMMKLGAAPDIYTYNAFIKCLCTNDRVDEALGLLSSLKGNECTPNEHTYSLLTEALLRAGRSQEVNELIRDCKKSNTGD